MERGASPAPAARAARNGAAQQAAFDTADPQRARGGLRRLLAGFADSCALAVVALLGGLAVVAVGTIGSLVWMVLLER